jgi:hypothetical protein
MLPILVTAHLLALTNRRPFPIKRSSSVARPRSLVLDRSSSIARPSRGLPSSAEIRIFRCTRCFPPTRNRASLLEFKFRAKCEESDSPPVTSTFSLSLTHVRTALPAFIKRYKLTRAHYYGQLAFKLILPPRPLKT